MTKRSYRDDVREVSAVASFLCCARFYCVAGRPFWSSTVSPAGLQRLTAATLLDGGRLRLSMQVCDADTGSARCPSGWTTSADGRRKSRAICPPAASAITMLPTGAQSAHTLGRYQRPSRPTIINNKLKIVHVTHVIVDRNRRPVPERL